MSLPSTLAPSTKSSAPLLGQSLINLTAWVQRQGQPSYRGKQLHQWIYEKGARSLADITVFPKQWRTELQAVEIGRSQIHFRSVAPDGTVKFLLRLTDGQIIEAVGIPTFDWKNKQTDGDDQDLDRLTVCVSSQVGCPMGCDFAPPEKGALSAT